MAGARGKLNAGVCYRFQWTFPKHNHYIAEHEASSFISYTLDDDWWGKLLTRTPLEVTVTFAPRPSLSFLCQWCFNCDSLQFRSFPNEINFSRASMMRQGFLRSVQIILQIREGGLATAGPPCGSFVWINSFTSQRSKERPLGGNRAYVKDANKNLAWIRFRKCLTL